MSADQLAKTVAEFRTRFGIEPAGVWSAPGRVNLIGEHTDYNLGFSLPFAIDRRTVVAATPLDVPVIRVSSDFDDGIVELALDRLQPDAMAGWSAYPLGVLWAFGEHGVDVPRQPGLALHFTSRVPIGAGLSSSAALECATAVAAQDIWGTSFDRPTLARIGQLAENVAVGAPTGVLDQSASMLGEPDSAVFLDFLNESSAVVELGFAAAGLSVLVIDSKAKHEHSTGGYAAVRAACERGAAEMGVASLRELGTDDLARAERTLDEPVFRRVRHVVTENARTLETVELLRSGHPERIGPLLDGSHASLRDDFGVSTPELDLIVDVANANGALGARMTGGGFGGSAIALVPDARIADVAQTVAEAFAAHGYGVPDPFVVAATAGARRDLDSVE